MMASRRSWPLSSPQGGNGRRKCQRLATQTLAKSSWPLTNTQRGRRGGLGRQPGIKEEGGKAVMGERAHTASVALADAVDMAVIGAGS